MSAVLTGGEVVISCTRAEQVWASSCHSACWQGKWAEVCWEHLPHPLCMAERGKTPAFIFAAARPCTELPFPNGIAFRPILAAALPEAVQPGARSAGGDSHRQPKWANKAAPVQSALASPPLHANKPCGNVNTSPAFICTLGAGIANPFVPRKMGASWIQQSPTLFLKQILLAGSFAYPHLWKTG